jgi:hypothetical protein
MLGPRGAAGARDPAQTRKTGSPSMHMAFVAKKQDWHKWFMPLGVLWLFLNLFDLGITFWAIQSGLAVEANRWMANIIPYPVPATLVKLGLSYVALKLAERIELKTRFSSVPILAMIDAYLLLACISNVLTCFSTNAPTWFHRFFPLA